MTKTIETRLTRLMRRGTLSREQGNQEPSSLELRRGMKILSCEREELGTLAAVLEATSGEISGLVLVRGQKQLEYRVVLVKLIEEVGESAITLRLDAAELDELPIYRDGP